MLIKVNKLVCEVAQGTLTGIQCPAGKASAGLQCLPLQEKEERACSRTIWYSTDGSALRPLPSHTLTFVESMGLSGTQISIYTSLCWAYSYGPWLVFRWLLQISPYGCTTKYKSPNGRESKGQPFPAKQCHRNPETTALLVVVSHGQS